VNKKKFILLLKQLSNKYHFYCDVIIFYVYVQHSIIVINSSIFQIVIAIRPITLVMGKISYEDKALIDRHYGNLVLDTEQLLQNFRKRVENFGQ